MKIFKTCAVGAILLFGNAHINAYANNNIGLYSNDLAKCMVISLNDNDKRTIQAMSLQMIFSHPNFSQKNPYSTYEILQTKQQTWALLTRLIAKDCTKEFLLAMHYDDEQAINSALTKLGQYVFADITNYPSLQSYSTDIANYVDKQKIKQGIERTLK